MYFGITKQDSDILIPYIDDRNSKEYQKYKMLSSGIVLPGKDIYSISDGEVLFVGIDAQGSRCVIVQYNASQCFSYCLMDSIFVKTGDAVLKYMKIGTSKKQVRFEYLTTSQHNSIWAVRVSGQTYYKHNPISILKGYVELGNNAVIESGHNIQTIFRSTP